jgi:metal-sulfur cluster biosynthetic enzyme
MQAGDHVYERSACLQHRFEEDGEDRGFADLVSHQRRLLHPITQAEAPPAPKAVTFENVMDALRGTNEFELYVQGSPWGQRQLSFVDIGVVRNVAIEGNDIHVDVVMPYAGRETWLGWFSEEIEKQLRERLRDVGDVVVELVQEPKWTPQQVTDRARRAIGPST